MYFFFARYITRIIFVALYTIKYLSNIFDLIFIIFMSITYITVWLIRKTVLIKLALVVRLSEC